MTTIFPTRRQETTLKGGGPSINQWSDPRGVDARKHPLNKRGIETKLCHYLKKEGASHTIKGICHIQLDNHTFLPVFLT
jgi:hypothetical protein